MESPLPPFRAGLTSAALSCGEKQTFSRGFLFCWTRRLMFSDSPSAKYQTDRFIAMTTNPFIVAQPKRLYEDHK